MPRLSAASIEAGRDAVRASEIPMLLGLSSYGGPHALWQRLTLGPAADTGETLSQRLGHLLEGPTRELVAEREHVRIKPNELTVRHRKIPLVATPDGTLARPSALYEGKARTFAGLWGEAGDPEGVPVDVRVQIAAQRAVWRRRLSLVGVLIGGSDPRAYWVESDRELEQAIEEAVVDFMGYVDRGEPPPVDGSDDAAAWLRARYRRETADVEMVATAEQVQLVEALREAAAARFAAEDAYELACQRIQDAMEHAGASVMLSPAGRIGFKPPRETDWAGIAAELDVPEDLVRANTTTNWKAVVETLRPRTEVVDRHRTPGSKPRFSHPFTRAALERSSAA